MTAIARANVHGLSSVNGHFLIAIADPAGVIATEHQHDAVGMSGPQVGAMPGGRGAHAHAGGRRD